MPRYKRIESGLKLIPVDFSRQVLAGSFEFALCHLIDEGEVDLSRLEARLKNDDGGAPAYHPAVLLKIVLLAYSRGIVGSRQIKAACRNNVLFMAVSGDSAPHFTSIADFVSGLGEEVKQIFTQVLLVCDRQGLIGRQMFAIDGVKLPSNAAKAKSGKRVDFLREAQRMEAAVAQMLARHGAMRYRTRPCNRTSRARSAPARTAQGGSGQDPSVAARSPARAHQCQGCRAAIEPHR
jgi:transposase